MSNYGSLNGNQGFYGSQLMGSLSSNGSMTANPSYGSLGNMSRTRVNNRAVLRPVPTGRVLTNSMLESPNGSMVNNGNNYGPPPQVHMNQNIPQDLIQRAGMNCDAIVREAYQRGYQDAMTAMQYGMGKKKRYSKKKKTTRKLSTTRK